MYYWKQESKYNKSPCFVEKNLKTTIRIYGISKQNLWFSTPSTYNSSYFSQNSMFNNSPLFQTPPFG
jgi:hypothetical protein